MLPCSCFRRFNQLKANLIMPTFDLPKVLSRMDYEYRMNMLAELKKLQAGEITFPNYGICWNLPSDVELRFPEIAEHWPQHSGSVAYPIPGGAYSFTAHRSNGSLWVGPQLEYRQSLIAFAIDALENF